MALFLNLNLFFEYSKPTFFFSIQTNLFHNIREKKRKKENFMKKYFFFLQYYQNLLYVTKLMRYLLPIVTFHNRVRAKRTIEKNVEVAKRGDDPLNTILLGKC